MDTSPRPDKAGLRARLLDARRATPAGERAAADRAILAALTAALHRLVGPGGTVCAYAPMAGEPGGADLPAALAAAGYEVLLPVLMGDGDLHWAEFTGTLTAGRLRGLREPDGRAAADAHDAARALVVPALAVGRDGRRLGRGGGSYDRALARVRPGVPVIALLGDDEVLDAVPYEPHDRPVTAVVTPDAGYRELGPGRARGR